MCKVINLATNKEMVFSCSPLQAVVNANEQYNGNYNPFTYDYSKVEQVKINGREYYVYGDCCIRIK